MQSTPRESKKTAEYEEQKSALEHSSFFSFQGIDNLNYSSKYIKIATPPDIFTELRDETLLYLETTIKQFYPDFSPEKSNTKVLGVNSNQRDTIDLYATFNTLIIWDIPQLQPGSYRQYCPLKASVGGVTKKVVLISVEAIMETMQRLLAFSKTTGQIFNAEQFSLEPDAIIKLPKNNEIIEVQREAIALNLSRILGFNTTDAVMLMYENKPALFVPFAKIKKLYEFAHGKKEIAFETRKPYIDFATIKTVGEGLMPDQCIEDVGKIFAFLYLCSDTDAIGGYNQNKALLDSRYLFIFDQVLMSETYITIDSCMNLSIGKISSLSRHLKGRNKTLAEDSSIAEKVKSIIKLVQHKQIFNSLMNWIIQTHKQALDILSKNYETPKHKTKMADLTLLSKDAAILQDVLQKRINEIFKNFPKLNSHVITPENAVEVVHLIPAFILEKILNHPRLFTDDGRPYKHLRTESHTIKVTNVLLRASQVEIKLNKDILSTPIATVFSLAGVEWRKTPSTNNGITMSLVDYQYLCESNFFPENATEFDAEAKYIPSTNQLELMKQTYKTNDVLIRTSKICIDVYLKTINDSTKTYLDKIDAMKVALSTLKLTTSPKDDVGFIKHMIRKFHFDFQKQLQNMVQNRELQAHMIKAFNAAIKLNQIAIFNDVIMTAISTNKLFAITPYLTQCIAHGAAATNFHLSKEHSDSFFAESETFQRVLLSQPTLSTDNSPQLEEKTGTLSSGSETSSSMMMEDDTDADASRDRTSAKILVARSDMSLSPISALAKKPLNTPIPASEQSGLVHSPRSAFEKAR